MIINYYEYFSSLHNNYSNKVHIVLWSLNNSIYDRLHCNTAGAGSMTVPKLNSPAPGPVVDSETGMGHKDTIADCGW